MAELYIHNHCRITDSKIWLNNEAIATLETPNVNDFLKNAYSVLNINYPKYHKMDNLCKLGLLASDVLLSHGQKEFNFDRENTAIVLSNSHSSLDTDYKYQQTINDENFLPSPAIFVYTLPNIVMGEICIKNKFKGENTFFISESFDADLTSMITANIFNKNKTSAAIVGWINIFKEEYDAFLMLVSPNLLFTNTVFSTTNISKIYQKING